jgi:hypothetical protein
MTVALAAAPAYGVTRQSCEAQGGSVEPSGRGESWWKCCLAVPSGILKSGGSKICFVCKGESPQSNCDQIPYVDKEKSKPADPSATKATEKPK